MRKYYFDFFDDKFFNDPLSTLTTTQAQGPKCNIYTFDDDVHSGVKFDLFVPGYSRSDINISIDNHVLTIESHNEHFNKHNKKYLQREFFNHKFKRSWSLPKNVNIEKIDASYDSGILSVTVPYENTKKSATKISIN